MRQHRLVFALLLVLLGLPASVSLAVDRVPLLLVSRGNLPNDTSLDNQTRLSIEDSRQLGGKALKVVYAEGDSFGMSRGASYRDWRPYHAVTFSVLNPASEKIELTFSVRHRGTADYQTRIDVSLVVEPGKNNVRLPIDDFENIDGSRPDLSDVKHWYLTCGASQTPTLYFGDFFLVGEPRSNAERLGDDARLTRIRAAQIPEITQPVQFNTPQADAILSALEVFPPDNAFNRVIDDWPLHRDSQQIVASIGADKPLRYNTDMSFVLVPPDQERVPVKIVEYPGESDRGPFPVPENIPLEGWPAWYQRGENQQTLADVQQRPAEYEGDRHAIVVDPQNRMLYEFFTFGRTATGWAAGQASVFDLKSNELRPQGWTSADAAGLPIFPAVVRYDEIERGMVQHAMRFTVRRSRRAYVHPATHFASALTDEHLPRMGERFRLRADFDVSGFSPSVQAILKGLKKYGMLVADNGLEWAISVTPDQRIPVLHEELRKIKGADFEVVVAPN